MNINLFCANIFFSSRILNDDSKISASPKNSDLTHIVYNSPLWFFDFLYLLRDKFFGQPNYSAHKIYLKKQIILKADGIIIYFLYFLGREFFSYPDFK